MKERTGQSRLSRDAGQMLVETIVAITVLAVLAASAATLLTGSVVSHGLSRQRTLAEQLALQDMESIRQLPYASVGLTSGNPPGTLAASQTISTTGLHGTLTRQVRWVDDQASGTPYSTHADYKRVTITVTRNDGKVLSTQSSFVSPFDANSYGGPNVGTLQVTVQDMGTPTSAVIPGVSVSISGGPSGSAADTTDATGVALFPALKPNPPSGAQKCYEVTVTPPPGYVVYAPDAPKGCTTSPADAVVVAGAPTNVVIRTYKPASPVITVDRWKAPFLQSTTVTLTAGVSGSPFNYTVTTGSLTGPATLPPDPSYTVNATSGTGANKLTAPTQSVVVPDAAVYPGTSTVSVSVAFPDTTVTVYRRTGGSRPRCTLQANQQVTVTGGPDNMTAASPGAVMTTDSNGHAAFDLRPGPGYSVASSGSAGNATLAAQTVQAAPNATAWTITVLASGASGTCP